MRKEVLTRQADEERSRSQWLMRSSLPAIERFAVGAGDHHHVAVAIADPHLAVARCFVDVRLLDHLCVKRARSRDRSIEVVDLEPEEDAVPGTGGVSIGEIRVRFE